MPETYEFDLLPSQVTFDAFGRVIVKNNDFINALTRLEENSVAATTCNNGCGDTGCGNTANAGCSSSSKIHFDDWTTFGNEVLINNSDFSKAILHSKLSRDNIIPILIEEQL